jgi:hypothetical protein
VIDHAEAARNLEAAIQLNATAKQHIRTRLSDSLLDFGTRRALVAERKRLDAEDLVIWDELRQRRCKARAA